MYHLYVLLAEDRAALAQYLSDKGVQTLIHYPVPIHRQEPCRGLRRDPAGLTSAERHAACCLSIPCHPQMSEGDIVNVIDALNRFR